MAKLKRTAVFEYKGDMFVMSNNSNYGCGMFILDCLLTLITGGLWLIWIFVREMRKR